MPAESKAQYRFMQAMLHDDKPKKRGKKRPSKKVAREFVEGQSPAGLPEKKRKGKGKYY